MHLRPYQADLINDLYRALNEGYRKILLVAGTGSGKTVISARICADAIAAGQRVLFLVHLDVLVGQTWDKMHQLGLNCGFIKAGWPEDESAPVQIASVQTLAQRDWWRNWPADIIVYDEAHTVLFSQAGQEILGRTHADAIHLAKTATPKRLGREQLGDHLEVMVASPTPRELQEQGYLAKMRYYSMGPSAAADISEVATSGGDYEESGLKNACDRGELIEKIVSEWVRLCAGKRSLAFCVDTEHACNVAAAFAAIGVPSAAVTGDTPIKLRQEIYAALGAGDLLVLASCNVLSIGFDEPSVEVGLLLRPTQSEALHLQQIGRVMRISPGKDCGIILDQAGNLKRLGFPEDITFYEMPYGNPAKGNRLAPKKYCPCCQKEAYTFTVRCSGCGFWWPSAKAFDSRDMIEISGTNRQWSSAELAEAFRQARRTAYLQGYAPGYAEQAFARRFKMAAIAPWYLHCLFGKNAGQDKQFQYLDYLQRCAKALGKDWDWAKGEFEKEFGENSISALLRSLGWAA